MKALTGLVAAVTVVVALALAWVLLVAEPRYSIYSLAGDDAGYYFAIARNICLGHGVSFDRIRPTSGFNPLEIVLLVAAYRIGAPGLGIEACYRVGVLVSLVALAAAGLFFARLAAGFLAGAWGASAARRFALAACVAFFAWFVCLKNNFGLDGPLVLLLGSAYLVRVLRGGALAPGARAGLADGALLAALFLARVDSLPFLLAAFTVMAGAAIAARAPLRPVALRAATVAALSAPYLVWSVARFGTWLPISARIKTRFPHADLAGSLGTILHTSLNAADRLSFLVAFALAVGFAAAWLLRRRPPLADLGAGPPAVLAILTLYLLARFGYMLLFSRADVQGSYVLLAHVYNVLAGIAVLGAWSGSRPERSRERALALAAGLLLIVAGGLLALKAGSFAGRWRAIEPGGAGDETAFARAIHEATGPGDVLYGGSFGMLGFLADRPWINGDGVANDADYQRAIGEGALARCLADRGVTYVVFLDAGAAGHSPRRLDVHGFVSGRSDSIVVDPREVVLRWRSLRGGGGDVAVARWRRPRPDRVRA